MTKPHAIKVTPNYLSRRPGCRYCKKPFHVGQTVVVQSRGGSSADLPRCIDCLRYANGERIFDEIH
jgi:hypothetical protein